MIGVLLVATAIGLAAAQGPSGEIRGTLHDRLVAEGVTAQKELERSTAGELPGLAADDRVFRAVLPQLRTRKTPEGLSVAYVATRSGGFLFVDANLDGALGAAERRTYTAAPDYASAPEFAVELGPLAPEAPPLPFRCRVVEEEWEGETHYYVHFTAMFRAEGIADIGGRPTLISLPYDSVRAQVEFRRGKIGIDANRDGMVDLRGVSGPEVTFAKGEQVVLRVGDEYVSVESADYGSRSFVLRVHPAEDYAFVEIRTGALLPDFAFVDFDGRGRRLSEFRGKYVLVDFWGSWCAPCVADLPELKAAYERFRDRGFEIVGIDYEHGAPFEAVRALLEEKGVTWTNARPDSVKELVEKRLRIWGFPTLLLLDPEGVVIESRTGELRGDALIRTLVEKLETKN